MELDLRDKLCFGLYSASRAITNLYRPLLAELGLTYPQYLVMVVLWERGTVTVSELGTALRLDSGTVSPLLKRLEAAGLVTKTRRRTDERSVEVAPTTAGEALREPAVDVGDRILCDLGIPRAELLELRNTINRLTDTLYRSQP